jgi:hypothetical protein
LRVAGTGDGALEGQELVHGVDRPVAAEAHPGPGVAHAAEGLHALEAVLTQVVLGVSHRIARLLCPLEGEAGHHVQLGVAGIVRHGHRFVVGDDRAEAGAGHLGAGVGHGVQDLSHGALAGGMHMGSKPLLAMAAISGLSTEGGK